jgi:hypothetical protein
MFDILGFRAMLDELGLAELMTRVHDLRRVLDRLFRWEAKFVTFSDTILLYSRPIPQPTDSMLRFLIQVEADAFFRYSAALEAHSLMAGLPLRGGIAYGECVVTPSRGVFVGPPIVDAYLLSEVQDWIGVALHDSCEPLIVETDPPGMGVAHRYPVPMKGEERVAERWTLDWPRMIPTPVALFEKLSTMASSNQGTSHHPRWRGTCEFAEGRLATLAPAPAEAPPVAFLPMQHRER